jgi:acetyl-CoA acetyltransferase
MGLAAERLAQKYNISEEQDLLAFHSHQRAVQGMMDVCREIVRGAEGQR